MTDTDERLRRIAQIDADFEGATGWGSWMVSAANERERLVDALNAEGHKIPHRHQARNSWGGRVS